MVQLALVGGEACCTLTDVVGTLAQDWSATLGDGGHIATAASATRRRFAEWGDRPLSERERARITSYFGAVVRRTAMRMRAPADALVRQRLLAATIKADLLDAGWSAERASAEVLRMMGEIRGVEGAA